MVRQKVTNPVTNQPPSNDYTEKISDVAEKVKDGLEHVGKDFPNGMEPKGGGWYGSPDVIDPRDCDNYPESIYCGSNPVSKPKSPVGFDFDWGVNSCGAYASVKGEVAGFSLPTHSRAWIRPECRDDYERQERDRKDPPPQPPPDWSKGAKEPKPQYRPYGYKPDDIVAVCTTDTYYSEIQQFINNEVGWAIGVYASHGEVEETLYPTGVQVPWWNQVAHSGSTTALMSATGRGHFYNYLNAQWVWRYYTNSNDFFTDTPEPIRSTYEEPVNIAIPPDYPYGSNFNSNLNYQAIFYFAVGEANVWTIAIYYGRFGDIFPEYQMSPIAYSQSESKDTLGRTIARSVLVHERNLVFCKKWDGSPQPWKPPYDSPPPPKKDCCMQCCSSNKDNNDDLLRQLLKEIKDVKKVVGFEEFPVRMPDSLIDKDEGFIGNLIPNNPVSEPNIPRVLGRFIRYFDEVVGQWEIPIEVKDTDPNTPGDQPKGVRLKNMSETFADLYAMMIDQYIINQQILQVTSKGLIETGLTKQNAVQNYFAIMCLIDFFGFKYREISEKIPLSFRVGEEQYEEFIKNGEAEIKVLDVDINDKNVVTYKDDMATLKHAASIIKAVHFKKLDHKGDMTRQLIDLVKEAASYSGKVNKGEIKPDGSKIDTLSQFCEDAETEFSRQTGINTQTPYGRPYDQRPRITILNPDGGISSPTPPAGS